MLPHGKRCERDVPKKQITVKGDVDYVTPLVPRTCVDLAAFQISALPPRASAGSMC